MDAGSIPAASTTKYYYIYMSEQDILIALAQISIALAGFSAVAATFGKKWSDTKREQLTTLLVHSGFVLFASLIPLIFSESGETIRNPENYAAQWVIFSRLYVYLGSFYLIYNIYKKIKMKLSWSLLNYISFISFIVVIGFQIINILHVQSSYLYNLALTTNLAYGFIAFVSLVIPKTEEN